MKIIHELKEAVVQAIQTLNITGPTLLSTDDIIIEYPADKSHGDFATNIAMSLFGKLKRGQGKNGKVDTGIDQNTDPQDTKPNQVLDLLQFSSPKEFAQKIVDVLNVQTIDWVSEISVAGPGFINFTLSDAFLLSKMGLIIRESESLTEQIFSDEKVMVEFTDPNPFKELHIGHLYSNTVGESISRLYESLGATVSRVCYQGDVGMHVSKSIWGMKTLLTQQFPGKSIDEALENLESQSLDQRVNFLGKSYATGATAYKDSKPDQEIIKNTNYLVFICAQENLRESTGFEPRVDYKRFVANISLDSTQFLEVKKLYNLGRAWSLAYFDQMYTRIGMGFDEFFFESLVGEYGYQIVQEYLNKGIFEQSNGAVIFPGSKYGLHDRVFVNSLGLPTYEAKELGLAPEKYARFQYDKSIVITGNEIDEYFKVLLKALEFTNPDLRAKTYHKSHGMVRLPEGKMSSRTGKILTAQWLIDEAVKRVRAHMQENRPELDSQTIEVIAEAVGLGAIKYAFLKQSVGKDISFNFDESLSLTGNSGPYMQYTYVRCLSVLQKAQNEVFSKLTAEESSTNNQFKKQDSQAENKVSGDAATLDSLSYITKQFDTLLNNKEYLEYKLNEDEKDILRNLNKYSDIVRSSAIEFAPHHISNYLYELAQSFNSFYSNHKIISQNDFETKLRLMIVAAVAHVVKHGLNLLGIQTVEKM